MILDVEYVRCKSPDNYKKKRNNRTVALQCVGTLCCRIFVPLSRNASAQNEGSSVTERKVVLAGDDDR
jgi:hypothetical protein